MEKQTVKTPREIGREISAYFKNNRITHEEAAKRLGFASKQVVSNHLAGKKFGRAAAARYAAAYGFNELFLLTGKGELLSESDDEVTGLTREIDEVTGLTREIDELYKIIRIQAETIRNLTQKPTP